MQIRSLVLSGRQDSNLRPPAPKAGALTGLRYAPKIIVAVRGGFEPPVPVSKYAGLANRWFQPLTHLTLIAISSIAVFVSVGKYKTIIYVCTSFWILFFCILRRLTL